MRALNQWVGAGPDRPFVGFDPRVNRGVWSLAEFRGDGRAIRKLWEQVESFNAASLREELSGLYLSGQQVNGFDLWQQMQGQAKDAAAVVDQVDKALRGVDPRVGPDAVAEFDTCDRGWVQFRMPGALADEGGVQMSGLKLHIHTPTYLDVQGALRRLAPLVGPLGLGLKVATRGQLAYLQSRGDSQSNKGVVVYLPERAKAADHTAVVLAAMGGFQSSALVEHNDKLVPGDRLIANGVHERWELVQDLGRDVGDVTYHLNYDPAPPDGGVPTKGWVLGEHTAIRPAVGDLYTVAERAGKGQRSDAPFFGDW